MTVVLVTGDRNWRDRKLVREVLSEFAPGTVLKHGAARGLDTIACEVGQELGFDVRSYPADWARYGRAAGPMRNIEMLHDDPVPEVVIAFHDDLSHSKGTRHCVEHARGMGYEPRLIFHA